MGNRAIVGNLEEFLKFKQHNLTFIRIVTVCSFFVWLAAYLQTWFIIHKSQIVLNVNGKSTGALLVLLLLQRFLFERFYLNHSLQLFSQLAKVNKIFHSGSSRALQLLSGLLTNNFCLLSLPHLSGTSQWNNRFVVCCRCFCCLFLHYKNFSSRENRSERMSPLFFFIFLHSVYRAFLGTIGQFQPPLFFCCPTQCQALSFVLGALTRMTQAQGALLDTVLELESWISLVLLF